MKKIFALTSFIILFYTLHAFALTGDEALANFKARMFGIGKMTGNISWNGPSGQTFSGNFKYMAPGMIYVKFTNPSGKTIVSNGRRLWVYNKASNVCGIQDLGGGGSGGIAAMVNGYNAIVTSQGSGYTIKLKNNDRTYSNIILQVDSSFLLKKVVFKSKSGQGFTFTLSNVNTNAGIMKGLFEFNVPSNAQTVINPLNIK